MVDIDKIEQAAEAATPGPWAQEYTNKCEPDGEGGSIFSEGVAIVSQTTREAIIESFDEVDEGNFSFISACDPQTILKLIAVVRAAKAVAIDEGTIAELCVSLNKLRDALEAIGDTVEKNSDLR